LVLQSTREHLDVLLGNVLPSVDTQIRPLMDS
jgi:hypothetical protein